MKYKYQVDRDSLQFAFDIESSNDDVEEIAQEAADDFFSDHDGWENKWPCDFYIYSADGLLLGACKVEMEMTPYFSAYLKVPQKNIEAGDTAHNIQSKPCAVVCDKSVGGFCKSSEYPCKSWL